MELPPRSLTASAYNLAANAVQLAVNFARSVALARLLAPEVFGLYAFVAAIVSFSQMLPNFGLTGAFYARQEHEQGAALRVHFTLTALFSIVWALLLALGAAVFAPPEMHLAFWAVTGAGLLSQFTQTPRALLTRQLLFRRLAGMETLVALVDSAVAVGLALAGFGLWSLLAANLAGSVVALAALYAYRPVWRPAFGWAAGITEDFLRFGSKVMAGGLLLQSLDRVDDIWTGAVLGRTALGFYDRAYGFATYPRRVLSRPLADVATGTYAQVKGDRAQLSWAFTRFNALLARANFLFAGGLALVAPEFIRLALGERWLPMLDAFRLMLVFTLLDPLKLTVSSAISTSGAPGPVARARLVQLLVLLAGLAILGPRLGIAGVALAMDLMLVAGLLILFRLARGYVDFSLRRLFGPPALALAAGIPLGWLAARLPGVAGADLPGAAAKLVVFGLVYIATLLMVEREQLRVLLKTLQSLRRAPSEYDRI
jgi:O-antigen/teichoic acid export membrane protein